MHKKMTTSNTPIDPSMFTVEHDAPVPPARSVLRAKWAPLFAQLRPGSRIPCEREHVDRIVSALRKSIACGDYPALADCTVIYRDRCPDGRAGVFVVAPKPQPVGTRLAPAAAWPKDEPAPKGKTK